MLPWCEGYSVMRWLAIFHLHYDLVRPLLWMWSIADVHHVGSRGPNPHLGAVFLWCLCFLHSWLPFCHTSPLCYETRRWASASTEHQPSPPKLILPASFSLCHPSLRTAATKLELCFANFCLPVSELYLLKKNKVTFTSLIAPLPIFCNLSCRFQLLNQKTYHSDDSSFRSSPFPCTGGGQMHKAKKQEF